MPLQLWGAGDRRASPGGWRFDHREGGEDPILRVHFQGDSGEGSSLGGGAVDRAGEVGGAGFLEPLAEQIRLVDEAGGLGACAAEIDLLCRLLAVTVEVVAHGVELGRIGHLDQPVVIDVVIPVA